MRQVVFCFNCWQIAKPDPETRFLRFSFHFYHCPLFPHPGVTLQSTGNPAMKQIQPTTQQVKKETNSSSGLQLSPTCPQSYLLHSCWDVPPIQADLLPTPPSPAFQDNFPSLQRHTSLLAMSFRAFRAYLPAPPSLETKTCCYNWADSCALQPHPQLQKLPSAETRLYSLQVYLNATSLNRPIASGTRTLFLQPLLSHKEAEFGTNSIFQTLLAAYWRCTSKCSF